MKINDDMYACAIIGGGVAGLSLAIQLADKGIQTILFEKNTYPFHKVCGEYISMESWNFLLSLGLPLNDMNLPSIKKLGISSEKGFMLNAPLTLGGFGISRYALDQKLFILAKSKGVVILENCKVLNVTNENADTSTITTTLGMFNAQIVCGSFGKYTPSFAKNSNASSKKNINYIGVKYHIKTDFQNDKIELHNFQDGYCGISKIENDLFCLCYLATSDVLKKSGSDIRQLEENVLYKNSFLKQIFLKSKFIFEQPCVISNITFHKKDTYANGIFLLISFFSRHTNKKHLIQAYQHAWNNQFNLRIQSGYYLQSLFGKKNTTHLVLKTLDKLPVSTQKIIKLTHGTPF